MRYDPLTIPETGCPDPHHKVDLLRTVGCPHTVSDKGLYITSFIKGSHFRPFPQKQVWVLAVKSFSWESPKVLTHTSVDRQHYLLCV